MKAKERDYKNDGDIEDDDNNNGWYNIFQINILRSLKCAQLCKVTQLHQRQSWQTIRSVVSFRSEHQRLDKPVNIIEVTPAILISLHNYDPKKYNFNDCQWK